MEWDNKKWSLTFLEIGRAGKVPGDPKKYSCLIKHKTHNKTEIFKVAIFLNFQSANLNFDTMVFVFCCHMAKTQVFNVR